MWHGCLSREPAERSLELLVLTLDICDGCSTYSGPIPVMEGQQILLRLHMHAWWGRMCWLASSRAETMSINDDKNLGRWKC